MLYLVYYNRKIGGVGAEPLPRSWPRGKPPQLRISDVL